MSLNCYLETVQIGLTPTSLAGCKQQHDGGKRDHNCVTRVQETSEPCA